MPKTPTRAREVDGRSVGKEGEGEKLGEGCHFGGVVGGGSVYVWESVLCRFGDA